MIKITIKENIEKIEELIDISAKKTGRTKDDIKLIGVTKTIDVDKIREALDNGIRDIGENKIQELEWKIEELKDIPNYHMIGHLQTNKFKYIVGKTNLIHSLDRMSLVKEIDKRSKQNNLVTDVLLQVNIAREDSKFGLYKEDLLGFLEEVLSYKNIRIKGLMTMAPHTENEDLIRSVFRELNQLKKDIESRNYKELDMDYLSMGMTNDFQIAVEEGSNMVRVGSGIFGLRNY